MLKRFLVVAVVAAALLGQTAAPPASGSAGKSTSVTGTVLDTKGLEAYIRHLLMWPPSVEVSMTFPTPTGPALLPGFVRVDVSGSLGGKTEEESFFVSADSQTVIRGDVFDVKRNPFQSEIELLKTDDQPFLGVPGAPVKVVEFSDFQCPYCKQESGVVRAQLMQAFPNDVQLFYMDYPIDNIHPFARGAAVMGRCIYAQNNASFWAYHDWIFEHQGEMTAANLREKAFDYAKGDTHLDMAKLTTCAQAQRPRAEVEHSVAIGDALKISATPTLFINGRRMVGTVALEDLKMVVEHEIAWAKAQKKDADCCSVQLALPGMAPAGSGEAK